MGKLGIINRPKLHIPTRRVVSNALISAAKVLGKTCPLYIAIENISRHTASHKYCLDEYRLSVSKPCSSCRHFPLLHVFCDKRLHSDDYHSDMAIMHDKLTCLLCCAM